MGTCYISETWDIDQTRTHNAASEILTITGAG